MQPTTAAHLRKLFQDERVLEKEARGELVVKLISSGHPSPPRADEPVCTKSQSMGYYDPNGNKVAEAHCHLREDGTIGASGKPDPKGVMHHGIWYFLDILAGNQPSTPS